MERNLNSPFDNYLQNTFGGESPLLKALAQLALTEQVERMQVSAFEGRLLKFLVSVSESKRIVEIGSLYGYSATWMASQWDFQCEVHCFEKEAHRAEASMRAYRDHQVLNPILWHIGSALENLELIANEGPFDLCFIDADKANYPLYLDWAENNVKKGGLIIGDNTFLWGHVFDEALEAQNYHQKRRITENQVQAMRAFNLRLSDAERYDSTCLPTLEGLTVARKKF